MSNRYTSDLTDVQWNLIRPLLPTEEDGRGRPMGLEPLGLEPRGVVNAILRSPYWLPVGQSPKRSSRCLQRLLSLQKMVS